MSAAQANAGNAGRGARREDAVGPYPACISFIFSRTASTTLSGRGT